MLANQQQQQLDSSMGFIRHESPNMLVDSTAQQRRALRWCKMVCWQPGKAGGSFCLLMQCAPSQVDAYQRTAAVFLCIKLLLLLYVLLLLLLLLLLLGCRRPYLQQMARAGFFEPLALPLMLEQSMAHIE
jgi:hypothetical protein